MVGTDAGDSASEAGPGETVGELPQECDPGLPCDDGNPCTLDDKCKAGVCSGDLFSCDDGIDCTLDQCNPDGTCDNGLKPGWCFVDETCYEEGAGEEDEPCLECVSSISTDELTPDNTNACDDGDACTFGDSCVEGACLGKPVSCPADGNPCVTPVCVDGKCDSTPVDGPCDDGSACTKDDVCDAGACTGAEVVCDDGNPCTTDSCSSAFGCRFDAEALACDDGNPCTLDDVCVAGACAPGKQIVACDDGNPCTDDSCHPVNGCMHFPNSAACDDGDPCLGGDYCVGGVCLPGGLESTCTDGNPCTDDACVPGVGCVFENNAAPCDDGDICTVGDACLLGACAPGPDALACDDGNSCTDDACVPFSGCASVDVVKPCDDQSVCTQGDACVGGECVGLPIACDDGNVCTKDVCDPAIGCTAAPITSAECRPKIGITYPPRGVTLDGDPTVTVTGSVTSKAGPITSFTIGGVPVALNPDGSFAHPMSSSQGMNLIVAEAVDTAGGKARTTPSYYFSTKYYPVDAADPKKSTVPDGIMVFLGPEVWDDNNTADVDDLATIMTLYLKSLDLGSLIQNPVTTGTLLWCSYKMNVTNIKFGEPSVDLVPINGGLYLFVSIPNFAADIQLDQSGFLCPDMNGTATATSITISTNVLISMSGGQVVAVMDATTVKVNGLNIEFSGLAGFLLNWLINFFEGSFANQIADAFKSQLGGVIPKAIVDALNSLVLDQEMTVNPFLGGGAPVKLQIKTGISSVLFETAGATLGMGATVLAPKVTPHSPLGSIGRVACLSGVPEVFAFPKLGQLEMGLHDDFFNQLPFGMYYAGLFTMDVDPAALGADLSAYGITGAVFHVDFLLAPILTSCTGDGKLVLQIGDIQVDGTMSLWGMPVQMTLFMSLEAEAQFVAVDTPQGKQLSISLGEPRVSEVEITAVSGALAGAEDVLVGLVKDKLVGGFLGSFAGGAFGSFPIPDVDLSGVNPSVPPGSKISLDLQQILRVFGYNVLSGNVK